MERWFPSPGVYRDCEEVATHRCKIDQLRDNEVIWDPYHAYRENTRPIPEIAFYEGILVCTDKKAVYLPDRVMRQFGLIQDIPQHFDHHGAYFHQWQSHVISKERRTLILPNESYCVTGYKEWFVQYSHPQVQNPAAWTQPKRSTSLGSSSKDIDVEKIHETMVILNNMIKGGKKWCGKAWNGIVSARDTLLQCGVRPREEEEEEEEPATTKVYSKRQRKSTSSSTRGNKSKRGKIRKAT